MKILKLILFAMMISAASSAANAGTAPANSTKRPLTKTQASSSAPPATFSCEAVRFGEQPLDNVDVTLKDEIKFPGIDDHEEVTLRNVAGTYEISVNEFYATPANPYIIDTIDCDDYLNCKATRVKFTSAGKQVQNLALQAGGSGVSAILGSMAILKFKRINKGFSFSAISREENGQITRGVEVACTSK